MKLNNIIKQFGLYLVVGGIATVVEWICFYVFLNKLGIYYLMSTTLAFVFSTFANWLAGKIIMFKGKEHILAEIAKIYLTSIAGLLFNLALMWVFVDKINLNEMVAKILATGIVFIWNFLIRKLVIYKI